MSKKRSYKYAENKARIGNYKRNDHEEIFLDKMNHALQALEPAGSLIKENPFPLIFVLGVMRSGTTLATQLLGSSLDVGTIDNIIARFWLAPVAGTRLSQILLRGKRKISLESDYGKTSELSEPHEFSYFWQYWLKMENMPPYYPDKAAKKIDWKGFQKTIRNIGAAYSKPVLMKAFDVGYHIEMIEKILPEAIFVLVKRDLADIAVSLRKGRLAYYGNENTWLGSYPIEYEKIKSLKGKQQIAAQVFYLDKMLTEGIKRIPKDKIIAVELKEICANPEILIQKVKTAVNKTSSFDIEKMSSPPATLKFSNYRNTPDHHDFVSLIKKLK